MAQQPPLQLWGVQQFYHLDFAFNFRLEGLDFLFVTQKLFR
jgi:hypothetical protein